MISAETTSQPFFPFTEGAFVFVTPPTGIMGAPTSGAGTQGSGLFPVPVAGIVSVLII